MADHRSQGLDHQGARVGGGAAHRAHRPTGVRLKGLSLFLARPRPGLRRHPPDPEGGPQRGRVVRGRLRRPTGRAVAVGGRGASRASGSCCTGSTRAACSSRRRPAASARSRWRAAAARQGAHRVRPPDRRQPGDQPLARARHVSLRGVDDGTARAGATTPASSAAKRRTVRSTWPRRPPSTPPTAPSRPSAAWATPASTTSSATGARPGSRRSRRSPRR